MAAAAVQFEVFKMDALGEDMVVQTSVEREYVRLYVCRFYFIYIILYRIYIFK